MEKIFGTFIVGWLLLVITCGIGWISNIVKLCGIINDPVTGMMILRAIGIPLLPLGAILGLFV